MNIQHGLSFEHERAMLAARAESEHRQRIAAVEAELEATRRQLAEQLSENPKKIVPPGRRLLEWAMPVAATVLVAFVGVLAFGGDDAVAKAPTLTSQVVEIEAAPIVEAEPAQPVIVADTPSPDLPEPVQHKPVRPKHPKNPKNPKNPNPLTLVDPDGDPLG